VGGFIPLFIILQITFDFTTYRKKKKWINFTSFTFPSCVGHDGTLTSKFYLGFCLNKNFVGKVLVTHCIEIDYTLVTRSTEVDSTVTHNTEFDSMLSLKVKKIQSMLSPTIYPTQSLTALRLTTYFGHSIDFDSVLLLTAESLSLKYTCKVSRTAQSLSVAKWNAHPPFKISAKSRSK
jgi:hypothetical protein